MGLSAKEAAARLGCTAEHFYQLVRDGKIPQGKKIGARRYWTQKQVDAYLAEQQAKQQELEVQAQGLLTSEQVAARIGLTKGTISHYVRLLKFPRGKKIGQRHYWTAEQVDKYLAKQRAGQQAAAVQGDEPKVTRLEIVKQLGCTPLELWELIKAGKFPQGKRRGDRYYYRQAEVDEYLAKQQKPKPEPDAQALLNSTQVAERLGCSTENVRRLVREGELPQGKRRGDRYYWTAEQIDELKAKRQNRLNLTQVAELLGCRQENVAYLVQIGELPQGQKIGRRWYWPRAQIEELLAKRAGCE